MGMDCSEYFYSEFFFEEEFSLNDKDWMRRALELACKGEGFVSPNPLVGAVLVKDGRNIGEGWHERCGGLHAERNALKHCIESAEGSTLYVTLEPCCHIGRQPPCTQAILEAGIKKVVIGSPDPNPLVAGKGVEILRQAGIEVVENVMREECNQLNQIFLHYIRNKTPFVALKYGMTLDGKIACYTGASKWITSEESRAHVQKLRHKYRGIMTAVGTVIADNPLLNCRLENGRNPIRIVCDSSLRTPLDSQLVTTAKEIPLILATCCGDQEKQEAFLRAGCTIITTPECNGRVELSYLMKELGKREIDSILLEGGGTLNWSMLQEGLVHKVYTYVAPKLLGGQDAKTAVEGTGFPNPMEAVTLDYSQIRRLGEDVLIESEVRNYVHRDC